MPYDPMRRRVACHHCGAHRDLAIASRCLVCGTERYELVAPTHGDQPDDVDQDVITVAEAIDLALHEGSTLTQESRLAIMLRNACRRRALALAGRTA